MKIVNLYLTISICLALTSHVLAGDTYKCIKDFNDPSPKFRMSLNTHSIPTAKIDQDSLLNTYLANGYGGLATNVNWTDDYLRNEDHIKSMFDFVKSAKSKGMDVWLYDENWYPSGMANTYILDSDPNLECEGLFFADTTVEAGAKVDMPLIRGNMVKLCALPITVEGKIDFDKAIDLRLHVLKNRLLWQSPTTNRWVIAMIATDVLYEGFQAGTDRGGRAVRYPSLLMKEVGEQFVTLTHKRYADVLGAPLSTLFRATFTDEPSTMAQPYNRSDAGVFPWKQNVTVEFEKRSGEKLSDCLLYIMLDKGQKGQKLRYTYFNIISDLMSNNFFRTIKEYCASQGMLSGGHLLLEETMMSHTPLYGSIMSCMRELDVPGIDVLTGMPWFTRRYLYSGRLASSAAELEGRVEVMSEICPIADPPYHNGKEAPTTEILGVLNRQMVAGVTKFNNYLQLQHETPQGRSKINNYIARICSVMERGTRAARVGVYYPIESVWTNFRPEPMWLSSWDNDHGGAPEAQTICNIFDKVSDILYMNQQEFSYLDSRAMEQAKAEGDKFKVGKLCWDVIILPSVQTINQQALAKLLQFTKQGGTVIAIGDQPLNSFTEFPSAQIMATMREMQKSKNYYHLSSPTEAEITEILDRKLQKTIELSDGKDILIAHRVDGTEHVLFITNDSDKPRSISIKVNGLNNLRLLDPSNGTVSAIKSKSVLKLDPYRGTMIVGTATKF